MKLFESIDEVLIGKINEIIGAENVCEVCGADSEECGCADAGLPNDGIAESALTTL